MAKSYNEMDLDIPWSSMGPDTRISRTGRSIVPIGFFPHEPPPIQAEPKPTIKTTQDSDFADYVMEIMGTAIQGEDGKFVTCAHVIQAIHDAGGNPAIFAPLFREPVVLFMPFKVQAEFPFVDPRSGSINGNVDLAGLIVAAKSTPEFPYEVPPANWGDSSKVGIGHPVVIGGYPHGKRMYFFTDSNSGILQPTFYSGIISAILPATNETETRIFQVSIPAAGGMSGGALIDQQSGEVIGIVTSCVHTEHDVPLPMSYAIPSEVIAPYLDVIAYSSS
ncbi:MAG: serine protease [Thermoanaerobaculales bacterium]